MDTVKEVGRIVAGAYYDYQEVRLGAMNRIRDTIRKEIEGIKFDEVEEKKKERKFDKKYQDANLPKTLKKAYEDSKFTKKEYEYINEMLELAKSSVSMENGYKRLMMGYINKEELWTKFLSKVAGIGPVLSANLIKNFGYGERYEHVSSLWRHCGLHVVDGEAPKRKKGQQLDFNPKLRTLCWKIGDSFIKQNSPIYRDIYDLEKKRQMERVDENKPKNKMHAHLRAMRKMVKIFLQHYWIVGRTISKLPVSEPYAQDMLKHTHYISWKDVIQAGEDLEDSKHKKPSTN